MQRYRGNGDTWLLASLNYLGFEFGTMASAPWHGRSCIQIHNLHVPSYYVDTMSYKSGARFKMTLPGAYNIIVSNRQLKFGANQVRRLGSLKYKPTIRRVMN